MPALGQSETRLGATKDSPGPVRGLTQLPAPLTPLVGRREELRLAGELLSRTRLVTLTGTGGCGKTRLALSIAEQQSPRYRDGAFWVDLSATPRNEGLVDAVVAAQLAIAQSPGCDTMATLVRHLRVREALVVLDNCEHVADECAVVLERLLRGCPELRVVVTSREVIGVPWESVLRLGGLALAGDGADLAQCEAVQLFLERAAAIAPGFEPAAGDLERLVGLCARLDGLPLAIELAAARVGLLSLTDIAARFEGDAGLLRHPSRIAPERHRTLAATLDWSHGLLPAKEQVLFRRLGCFRGSFSLLAAEAVAGADPVGSKEVLDLLAGLVDKSLLQVADRGAEHRYRLLDTVRHYAQQRLDQAGEHARLRGEHSAFYLELALQAAAGLDGPDQLRWLDRLEIEHDNLRAALEWSLPRRPEQGCRLAAALWPFWYRRGHYNEGRSWLEQAAAAATGVSAAVKAATLTGAGVLAFYQCDYPVALERLGCARDAYEAEGDRLGLATVLQRLGAVAREQARYDDARRLHEQSKAVYDQLGDAVGVAACEDQLGFVSWLTGEASVAIELCSGALRTFRAAARSSEVAGALVNLGAAHHLAGEDERAAQLLREALALSEAIGYAEGRAWSLHELALVLADSDAASSASMLAASLRAHFELGDRWRVASVLESIAALVLAGRDPLLSAKVLGAARGLREALGAPAPPCERPLLDSARHLAAGALAPELAARAEDEGAGQALGEAVELAAGAAETAYAAPASRDGPAVQGETLGLTERELEVLRLLAAGRTNRDIGAELFISAGTAGVHVSNILRKLGVTSRVQAAGVAHERGLARS